VQERRHSSRLSSKYHRAFLCKAPFEVALWRLTSVMNSMDQYTWNGTDARGRGVVSGVYFYRLQAPGYTKTLKMILIQ
jgi:hypothetical protein